MDIVIRTATGDAEVSVVSPTRERARIADVVAATTGEPCPPTLFLNSLEITSDQTLDDAGVLAGSVLSTVPPPRHTGAVTTLVQVAGPGAGTVRPLRPGHFRIGPGRRMSAPELAFAPVDGAVVSVSVRDDGTVDVWAATDATADLWIEGEPLDERRHRWNRGMLLTRDRAFLHRPPTALGPDFGSRSLLEALLRDRPRDEALELPVAPDGTIPLRRASHDTAATVRWSHRADDDDAFEAMIGVRPGEPGPDEIPGPGGSMTGVPLRLMEHRSVGVVGSSDVTRGMARGLLLQLAARHGPVDLRIAVATSSDQLRAWEWLKWLPHAHARFGPLLFTTRAEFDSWLQSSGADVALTLVLADDPAWWSDRGGLVPLLPSAANAPRGARQRSLGKLPIHLCGDASLLPATCDVTLAQGRDGRAVINVPGRAAVTAVPVLPPLTVAEDIARRMSRYSDPERAARRDDAAVGAPSLRDLLGAAVPAWTRRGAGPPRWSVPIGLSRVGGWVSLDPVVEGPDILVAGDEEIPGVGAVLESTVLAAAAMVTPRDLCMVLLDLDGRSIFDRCARLPHVVAHLCGPTRHEAWRMSQWLRGLIGRRRRQLADAGLSSIDDVVDPPFARLLVAVDELVPFDPVRAVFADEIARMVHDLGTIGVHLLLGTSRPDALEDHPVGRAGSRIALRTATTRQSELAIGAPDAAGLPRSDRGHAILRTGDALVSFRPAGFATHDGADRAPSPTTATAVVVRPYVIGRQPTPMEARLAQAWASMPDRATDPFADGIIDDIIAAARGMPEDHRHPRWYPPLPEHLLLADVLDQPVLDEGVIETVPDFTRGAPFGLLDRPDRMDRRPLLWRPGSDGSTAVVGATRRESRNALRSMLLAAVCRWTADDLHIYLVGESWHISSDDGSEDEGAWSAATLPHVGAVATDEDEFIRLTRLLVAIVGGRRTESTVDRPRLAVLVDDADRFRARLSPRGRHAWERFEDALVAGRPHDVCAVLATDRPDPDLERLLTRLVATRVCLDGAVQLDRSGDDRTPMPSPLPGRGRLVAEDGTDLGEIQLADPAEPSNLPIRWRGRAALHRRPQQPDQPDLGE